MNNHTATQNRTQFPDPPQGSIITDLKLLKALQRDRTVQFYKLDQWVDEAFGRYSKE